jgi:hypothetical protein
VPAAFSAVGGFLLLAGAVGALLSFGGSRSVLLSAPQVGSAFFGLGFLTGVLVLAGAGMIYARPDEHLVWGWLVIVFGLVGFGPWNYFGAYSIGSILSIIGGVMGLAFQYSEVSVPAMSKPDSTPPSFLKNCVHCGAQIPIAAETCSSCGKPQKRASG